jgi:hypothetical protein
VQRHQHRDTRVSQPEPILERVRLLEIVGDARERERQHHAELHCTVERECERCLELAEIGEHRGSAVAVTCHAGRVEQGRVARTRDLAHERRPRIAARDAQHERAVRRQLGLGDRECRELACRGREDLHVQRALRVC